MCLAVLMPAIAKSPKYVKYISSKTARLSLPYFASLDCLSHIRNQLGVFLSSQAASTKNTLRTEHRCQKISRGVNSNHWKESTSTTYLDLVAEEHALRRSVFMFSMEVWCTQRCSACWKVAEHNVLGSNKVNRNVG